MRTRSAAIMSRKRESLRAEEEKERPEEFGRDDTRYDSQDSARRSSQKFKRSLKKNHSALPAAIQEQPSLARKERQASVIFINEDSIGWFRRRRLACLSELITNPRTT